MTKPTDAEMAEFWRRLRLVIERGLFRAAALYGAETASAMAEQFATGQWRLMTEIDMDGDKQPVPGSLAFRVDLWVPSIDDWEEWLAVKASYLGVTPELEAAEAAMTALQNVEIPDDLSGLTDP
jgi:hypothetical protein